MVRFESKFHLLPSLVKIEEEVEMRVSMHPGRMCPNFRVIDYGQVIQRVSADRMCCDKPLACVLHLAIEWFHTLDRGEQDA